MKDLLNAVSGVKIGVNDPILRDNQNTFIVSSKGVTGTNSFVLSNILPNDDCHVFCMTTFEDDFKKVSDKTVACAFALNLLFSHCKYVQSKLSEEIDVFAMKIYHFLSNLKITGPNISQKINLILMDLQSTKLDPALKLEDSSIKSLHDFFRTNTMSFQSWYSSALSELRDRAEKSKTYRKKYREISAPLAGKTSPSNKSDKEIHDSFKTLFSFRKEAVGLYEQLKPEFESFLNSTLYITTDKLIAMIHFNDAYKLCLSEIVKRKEFYSKLKNKEVEISNNVKTMKQEEEKRRNEFLKFLNKSQAMKSILLEKIIPSLKNHMASIPELKIELPKPEKLPELTQDNIEDADFMAFTFNQQSMFQSYMNYEQNVQKKEEKEEKKASGWFWFGKGSSPSEDPKLVVSDEELAKLKEMIDNFDEKIEKVSEIQEEEEAPKEEETKEADKVLQETPKEEELQKKVKEFETKMEEMNNEKRKMREELIEKQNSLENKEKQLLEFQKLPLDVQNFEKQLKNLQNELAIEKSTKKELEEENSQLKDNLAKSNSDLNDSLLKNQELKENLSKKTKDCEKFENDLKLAVETHKKTIDDLNKTRNEDTAKFLERIDELNDNLTKERIENSEKISNLKQDLEVSKSSQTSIESQLSAQKIENDDQKQKIQTLNLEVCGLEAQISKISKESAEKIENLLKFKSESEKTALLSDQIKDYKKKIDDLQESSKKLESTNQQLLNLKEEKINKLDKKLEILTASKEENEKLLNQKISILNQELNSRNIELDGLKKTLVLKTEQFEQMIKAKTEELQIQLSNEANFNKNERENLLALVQEKEEIITRLKEEIVSKEQQLNEKVKPSEMVITLSDFKAGDAVMFIRKGEFWTLLNRNCTNYYLAKDMVNMLKQTKSYDKVENVAARVLFIDTYIATANNNPYNLKVGTPYYEVYIQY